MAESTRQALVVSISLLPHDNSDFLSIVKVSEGYQVVVRTEEWVGKDRGCFIQPDSIVDVNRPEFSFLKDRGDVKDGKVRIRACKFRGVLSFGILIPTDAEIGVDLAEQLGIEHYDPELDIKFNTGDHVGAPPGVWSKYDIESLRHRNVFVDGEPVVCTEKMEGCLHSNTLVQTLIGSIKISDIEIGEQIISFNQNKNQFEEDVVLNKEIKSEVFGWKKIILENQKHIICTNNHLILTTYGYKRADELTEKDDIITF